MGSLPAWHAVIVFFTLLFDLAFARDHFNGQLTIAECSEQLANLAVESDCVRPGT